MSKPDKALIEAIAEAIHRSLDGWPISWADLHEDMQAAYLLEARAAYAAMVEHLGLTEEVTPICKSNDAVHTICWRASRRLVSRWTESQP